MNERPTPETDEDADDLASAIGGFIDRLKRERDALAERLAVIQDCNVDLGRERDEARDQLFRICKEGLGLQDTIGLEPADDYVLRRLAAMREAMNAAAAKLRYIVNEADALWDIRDEARSAITKLRPFLDE